MARPKHLTITVARAAGARTRGILRIGSRAVSVALGRAGIKADKREGDFATPRGRFHPLRLWWRADQMNRPRTRLPVRRISPLDGWCENPADRRYNRALRLTPATGGDRLWRDDHLYDLIVEIDHNTRPRIKGRGSAVFLHVARPGLAPTAGCIAMPARELKRLVARLDKNSVIRII